MCKFCYTAENGLHPKNQYSGLIKLINTLKNLLKKITKIMDKKRNFYLGNVSLNFKNIMLSKISKEKLKLFWSRGSSEELISYFLKHYSGFAQFYL